MLQPVKPGERTGREGKPISNRVLLGLEDRAFRAIRPLLEFASFEHHVVLHETHRKIDRIYFPDDGLVSLVVVMANGRTAEAGVVGKEGIVGLEGLLGFKRGPLREIVQISGKAHSVPAKEMAKLLEKFPGILLRFSRFAIVNRMQISQTAACNRLHEIDKRLARWLLMTQDRVESGLLPMTHDFLATMLGTDRSSVSEAAGALQRQEIIQYTRGAVRVLNRKALEESSCECYELIRDYNSELAR